MKEKLEMLYSVLVPMIEKSCGDAPLFSEAPSTESEMYRRMDDLMIRFPAEWIFALEKVRSQRGRGSVIGELFLDDIKRALAAGKRVTLLMRHAERPPLDPSDTSFGECLAITERGKASAVRFGRMLADEVSAEDVSVFCSRTFRTIQTGCGILKGLGASHKPVVDDVLGGDTPFFGSLEGRMELIAEGRYLERLNEYFRVGEQRGYRPLDSAIEEMEGFLGRLNRNQSGLVIAVTHDINVAAFLAGRGVIEEFDDGSWPRYLDAAVIVEDIFGSRGYGVLRGLDRGLQ